MATILPISAPQGALVARLAKVGQAPKGALVARSVSPVVKPIPMRPLVGQLWP